MPGEFVREFESAIGPIREFTQPGSSGTKKAEEGARDQRLGLTKHVTFEGRLGSGKTLQRNTIVVLANEAGTTPSGGYPKFARVQRPQRIALTIHEGYEPFTLTVPILFDAWQGLARNEREDVELNIQKLEWMAGRGILFRAPFQAGVGKPPLVKVYSLRHEQQASELVPKPFQDEHISWFIEDITWDEHPLRGPAGNRRRQAAVVKLVQAVQDEVPPPGPPGPSYTTFRSTPSLNTVKKLVAHYMSGFLKGKGKLSEAVKKTIAQNKGNRAIGTNPEKKLKNHTPVQIPNEFL